MTGPSAAAPVSIVVPAYNEAVRIADTLTRLDECGDALADRYACRLVVVNDGSADATGALADAWAAAHPDRAVVVHHASNRGLGAALRTAFGHCTGDHVVVMDCDLTYAPDHVGRLLDALRSSAATIVIASPYMPGGETSGIPFVRRVASRSANRILGVVAPGRLRTLTGMVRAYDGRWLRALPLTGDGADINTEILWAALAEGRPVVEIPAHLDWRHLAGTRRAPLRGLVGATLRSLVAAARVRRRVR